MGVIGRLGNNRRYLLHAGGSFHQRCRLFIRALRQILIARGDTGAGVTQHDRTGFYFSDDPLNIFNGAVIGAVQGGEFIAARHVQTAREIALHAVNGGERRMQLTMDAARHHDGETHRHDKRQQSDGEKALPACAGVACKLACCGEKLRGSGVLQCTQGIDTLRLCGKPARR